MKHAQRKSFELKRITAAVAVALAAQFAADIAQAGAGFGSGVTVTNSPIAVPTYFANSPSGPVPVLSNGQQTIRTDGSGLPVMGTTGSAMRKFVDTLPGFGSTNANNLGQYIPVAVPDKWVDLNSTITTDDYYEIAAVEFTEKLHSDLPKATRLRGYVQLETAANAASSKHIQLFYPVPAGSPAGTAPLPITDPARVDAAANPNGYVYAYDSPHHLGPVIQATKGTAVRVKFTNYLPVGGKLFVPVDTTVTGAGMGPDGKTPYGQNRAEMHLVGGQAPWISAGTPHQWVAPAGETAAYAAGLGKGASAQNVPDMADPGAGSTTLYFPNDMSGRFTFYQDATSGIARLNAYAGLEGAYVVTDPVEQTLVTGGTLSGGGLAAPVTVQPGTLPATQIPLIFEDKTFVPANIAQQDALWTDPNWGKPGDLWFPHVYEPNQDPTQANGANPVGRWDYGPLFWPIFPVSPNKATLPSPSYTPEAYLDTPLVNGTAYPTLTVEPKAYRVRLLNASNDRYLNLGLYVADPSVKAPVLDQNGNPVLDASGVQQVMANTEVKMVPAAAINPAGNPQGWDVVNNVQLPLPQFPFPWHINSEPSGPTRAWPVDGRAGGVPDPASSGPDFVVIGNDGGFLPGAVDIPSQPITYEQNRRSITVTNIYGYGMLLGPAERADTIVDFTNFAGKTLILYNDAPAPTPFIDSRNDYYTGDPDQTALGGTYTTQPGYGPNTRTVMQIKVGTTVTSGGPLDATKLAAALPAAYAASQPRPLVTQGIYNAAFGTTDPDTFARVATGSAAQPTLDFSTSGTVTLTGFSLVTSGGPGTGSGSGYLTPPKVVITGGGAPPATQATAHATVNAQHQVASVVLDSAGSGYTSAPTVTFVPDSTVGGVSVLDGGAGYSATDTVNFSGGGGTGAMATLTVTTSASVAPAAITLTGGAGYTLPPTVNFVGGGTPSLSAVATATLQTSTLILGTSAVKVDVAGSGYTNPTAVVSAPQLGGVTATATPIVGFATAPIVIPPGGILPAAGGAFDGPLPPNGSGGGSTIVTFSSPQLQGGTPPVATVGVDPFTGAVTSIAYTSYGSGYTSPPTATISDGLGGSQPNTATVAATLAPASGQIFGATVTSVGSGYTAPATITFSDSTGTNASATAAVATVANGTTPSYTPVGTVNGLVFSSNGRGYTSAPTVQFLNNGTATQAASATVALNATIGAITSINMSSVGSGYTSPPQVTVITNGGTGANLSAGLVAGGVGAQAIPLTSNSKSFVALTKAEQELFDDYGRYNATGGVELPYTTANIQTTIPLGYIDAPTEVLGDGEVQVWKIVDNGLWTNSIHFNMANVQLINRVGWDGTVKPPASNEVGWRDTLRLNPLEDVIVAVQGKRAAVPFGQPRSTRLQDPATPANAPTAPAAPAAPQPGVQYASGFGFLADPNVVQQTGVMSATTAPAAAAPVPVGTQLLTTTVNTNVLPASPTGNYDNEFLWGSAILGHATDDLQRPVVFNPVVAVPDTPTLSDAQGVGTLTWTDSTPLSTPAGTLANPKNEIGFAVLQAPVTNIATGALGPFTPLANPFANVPANTVSYKEPAALVSPTPPNGRFYAYEVVAYNAAGASAPSNIVVEAPPAAPTAGLGIPLLTPGVIDAATTTADISLMLQWQDNAVNETNYIITKTGGPGATMDATGKVSGGTRTVITAPPNSAPISTNTQYFDPAPLVEGTPYEYDIVARNAFGDSVPVLWGSLVAPTSVPKAPTNVSATPTVAACKVDAVTKLAVPARCKPDDVVVAWTDAAFNETNYTIARSGGNVAFGTVTVPGTALNTSGGTLTYTDTTAQEGIAYTYTVSAVNAVGSKSTSTNVIVAATAPTVPTNVVVKPSTAVDAKGTYVDTATVTWSDNAYNEMSYQVLRDGLPVGTPIVGAGLANNPMGDATVGWTASPVLSFTDVGIGDGTTHTWTVQASNGIGTTTSTAAIATMPGIVIAPPANLIARPNRAGSSIGLQWTDMSTNETDFLVEESVSTTGGTPGSFSNWVVVQPIVARTAAQTTATGGLVTFNRANVATTPGYVYTFRVSARNLAAKSDSHPYAYVQANLLQPVLTTAPVLAAPTLSATGRVALTWSAVTPPAGTTISYRIFINGTQVNTANTTYSYRPGNAALQAGITYTVAAVATAIPGPNPTSYGSTVGPASNPQTVKATAPAAAAVPGGLAATIAPATGAVTLNWTAVTPAAGTTISYVVSVNGAVGVPLNRGGAIALATGASYQVQVASVATEFGLSTTSAYSAPITVDLTAAAIPSAPATLTVTATALNWTAPATVSANATVTYNVQQSINGGPWTLLTATPIAARTLAVASPVGSNYQYRVQAMATRYGLATSAPSAWTTTTFNTLPAQSTGLAATLTSTRNFSVSWNNASLNITGFTIQRRLGIGAWTTIAPLIVQTGTAYKFTDTVTAAGSYAYRVAATSAAGTTGYVTSVGVPTP